MYHDHSPLDRLLRECAARPRRWRMQESLQGDLEVAMRHLVSSAAPTGSEWARDWSMVSPVQAAESWTPGEASADSVVKKLDSGELEVSSEGGAATAHVQAWLPLGIQTALPSTYQ